ncbi:MAG: hypothetical protein OXT73_08270 [Bacteroidota bacterium]|nr:hypothetical protein [Bacteroidota bacterium]
MKKLNRVLAFLLMGAFPALPGAARQQANGPDTSPYGILSNSVANLHLSNDAVWVGPFLNYSMDAGATWYLPDTDSLFGSPNRLFSIDIEGDLIVAGLGRADNSGGDAVQTAAGFLVSEDGGATFQYRFPQLDDADDDTEVYGVSTLPALPVIVPQQSPPFDVDIDPVSGTIYVAGWASGIRRSVDSGRSFSRVVLPPDNLDRIVPEEAYSFSVEPRRGGNGSLNHMGFSVLVDGGGTVWAGTAGGLNRSEDGGISWQKFKADGTSGSLTGDWIISIEEQDLGAARAVWMATWNTSESGGGTGQFGVTLTRDGGQTFEQTLLGERVYDFAFDGIRSYVAGDGGLFVSDDFGRTWNSINQFRDASDPSRRIREDSDVFSVEVDAGQLWVGTSDGLLLSRDDGVTWHLFRVNVPLKPDTASDAVPRVDTYAYPNPFSPGADGRIRIKYDAGSSSQATIRLFDFGMNLVREWTASTSGGVTESIWDGRDGRGVQVANGTYFYEVEVGSSRSRGKILVIE